MAWTRRGKPNGTVESGANVKMIEVPARAAPANTDVHICSRSRTNGSEPNVKTVVSRSTTR
jgi:hypothetical protein